MIYDVKSKLFMEFLVKLGNMDKNRYNDSSNNNKMIINNQSNVKISANSV
jgi:hypothetical protein